MGCTFGLCVLALHGPFSILVSLFLNGYALMTGLVVWVDNAICPLCYTLCLGYSLKLKDDLNTNISYWKDIQQLHRLVKLK
jgi:hypothetical protein